MSEEPSETFKDGDIVWVKLGPSWWPAEVKDLENLDESVVEFKKKPLVIVKFFDEDTYEYVRKWTDIFPYNCEKKNDFIKKGMAAFRAKAPHMEKFPKDVSNAEVLIGGNPNILSDPIFLPEKKTNYVAEIFGTPSPKSKVKDKKSRPKTQEEKTYITHRRFLGYDDYRAYVCIQFPGKDRVPGDEEDEEVININQEPVDIYNCHSCSFTTKRLEIMIFHTKSHIQGIYVPSSPKKRPSVARPKKEKIKKIKTKTETDSSDDDVPEVPREKKRRVKQKVPKTIPVESEVQETPTTSTDIRSNLLAEWEDSDENLDETIDTSVAIETSVTDRIEESLFDDTEDVAVTSVEEINKDLVENDEDKSKNEEVSSKDVSLVEIEKDVVVEKEKVVMEEKEKEKEVVSVVPSEKAEEAKKTDIQQAIKSCFDFDEDDEDTIIPAATTGRKIPRVIPITERKKSKDIEEEDVDPNVDKEEILKTSESFNQRTRNKEKDELDNAFKELMDITAVPQLPDVQNSLKCEQNFHCTRTIKFPDKQEFAGSTAPNIDKTEESATKLTNPKKRFVKSFEDFENEIRKKEQEEQEKRHIEEITDEDEDKDDKLENIPEIAKLKCKIMSKIIEEAKVSEEKKEKILLKIVKSPKRKKVKEKVAIEETHSSSSSKRRTSRDSPKRSFQDLSKKPSQEDTEETVEPIKFKLGNILLKSSSKDRKPSSKIIESYLSNDTTVEEVKIPEIPVLESKTEEKLEDDSNVVNIETTKREIVPPKKNKWSRRLSHPKKNRHLFDFQDNSVTEAPSIAETQESEIITNNEAVDVVKSTEEPAKTDEVQPDVPKPEEDNNIPEDLTQLNLDEKKSIEEGLTVEIDSRDNALESSSINAFSLSSKDELSPIEKATVFLPDDAICLPHQKNKKRKSRSSVDESLTDLYLYEKRRKVDDVEKETVVQAQETVEPVLKVLDEIDSTKAKDVEGAIEEIQGEKVDEVTSTEPEESLLDKVEEHLDVEATTEQEIELTSEERTVIEETSEVVVNEDTVVEETLEISSDKQVGDREIVQNDDKEEELAEKVVESTEEIKEEVNDSLLHEIDKEIVVEECNNQLETEPTENTVEMKDGDTVQSENVEKLVDDACKPDDSVEPKKEETVEEAPTVDCTKTELQIEKIEETVPNVKEIEKEEIKDEAVETMKDEVKDETKLEQTEDDCKQEHHNEVEVELADNSTDGFKFSIQTNLSNFSSREEISAIALATLAEMKSDVDTSDSNISADNLPTRNDIVMKIPYPEPELVSIEGNLTVVSEKDLADGQVEITPDQVISSKKQMILTNFSSDFADTASNTVSINETSEQAKSFDPRGTEFTSKAMTREFKSAIGNKKGKTYERYELIDILEGTDSDKMNKELMLPKKSIVDDFCDFEDHIPPQIVCAKKLKLDKELKDEAMKKQEEKSERRRFSRERANKSSITSTTSKLLERLKEGKTPQKIELKNETFVPKLRSARSKSGSSIKPLILSDKSPKSKQLMNDIEDVEAFVIHKDMKKPKDDSQKTETKPSTDSKSTKGNKAGGKAKILQQTIITPAGEIIQPVATNSTVQSDDNIFDINSMPIVLSDEILTPESIENMPIVISTEPTVTVAGTLPSERLLMVPSGKKTTKGKIVSKITSAPPALITQAVVVSKPPSLVPKQSKVSPRILQTVGNKIKQPTLITGATKPGKYIIVPQSTALPVQPKTVTKKLPSLKKTTVAPGIVTTAPAEVTGNKIMILTNQQGQQQRLLLTPAQQKILGYHPVGTKIAKTIVKGNTLPKTIVQGIPATVAELGVKPPSLVTQKIIVSTSGIPITSNEQILMVTTPPAARNTKIANKRPVATTPKPLPSPTKGSKTILLKSQAVKKLQSTEEDLEKQVKEQLEAIRASSAMQFGSHSKATEVKVTPKTTSRRPYPKKTEAKNKTIEIKTESPVPSYVPLKKPESSQVPVEQKLIDSPTLAVPEHKPDRPLNQLVIQDAVGNQTTITEGQILALPSETVDGQPQSYMLVTLDESGNLTPLNNEALMSLDPNLTGDLSNMVLQIEPNAVQQSLAQPATVKTNKINEPQKVHNSEIIERPIVPSLKTIEIPVSIKQPEIVPEPAQMVRSVVPSTNGEPGQQLIISGDPVTTQKFLESLSEGTTDLANILANAEGNSILIQADGQQILINTNSENLLSVNNGSVNEGGGNPVFATQPNKSQDILAAALADTDVFQQDQPIQNKLTSQLSPNNALYPMNVGNVLETSLTLSSPIMTPLEVPSTNSKKIPDDEADILTQIPKNVDLPITITDPNISQTVANQQVSSLLPTDLPTNLELTIPIGDASISTSKEINSPYNHYSLPTLDESVDMSQKSFRSSMPLLNEDVIEESVQLNSKSLIEEASIEVECRTTEEITVDKPDDCINARSSFLEEDEEEEGRFTLGGEICSSLSEPPPEMFDLPEVNQSFLGKNNISSLQSTPEPSSKDEDTTDLSTMAESSNDSCEIPVQPKIVAKSQNLEAFGSD